MNPAFEILKALGTFVGGTILVFVAFGVLILLLGLLLEAVRGKGRKPSRPGPSVLASTNRLIGRIRSLVRPTLLLLPASEPAFSKLGGDPELPAGASWPRGDYGPLVFVAQIELGDVPGTTAIDWLPREGRVYVFYDPEAHGTAKVVRLIYSTEPPGPPARLSDGKRAYGERRVAFFERTSAPNLEWLDVQNDGDLDFEALEGRVAPLASAPPNDEPQHRVGGYPNEIQDECMRLSCEYLARGLPERDYSEETPDAIDRASRQWRMLLQVDSDPDLKMNFGDGGRLYIFVREQHARRADFSKAIALWQTY